MKLNNTPIFLCFLYFFLVPRCGIAVSNSTITSARYLRDGEIITSEDGSFNLGFFSPGNSTKRYVGIWFAKVVTQTIVWVANRETPLMDSSGVLKMGDDGNLVVLDGKEKIVWSSNARTTGNTSIGELLNSGNLIIREQESSSSSQAVQWESFDHPTDTFLAGMKFGLNLRTGENQLLTAWKNANDPAPGNFSLGFDPNKIAQIIIWNSSERYWRSGQWNGQLLTGVPEMTSFFLYGFNILTDTEEGRLYCTYSNTNKSIISSFLLSPTGNLERLYWNDMALGWDVSWSQPNSECQIYGQCGPYGNCNRKDKPICRCLPGFRPSVTEQWNSGNWSSGCVRNYQLECKDGNSVNTGFMELSGMKLPDFSYLVHAVQSRVDCHKSCERNCSCVAYSYDSGLGCLTWNDRLLDIEKFDDGGQVLYLRLNKASFKSRRKAKILLLVIILMIAGGLGMLVIIYAVYTCMKIKRLIASQRSIAIEDFNLLDFGIQPNSNRHFLDANELEKSFNKGKSPDLPIFSLEVVRTATEDFSMANKLGEGGFGPVYKGKLPSGQDIAVKRLSKSSGQGLLEFENEVIVIAKLQHRNLVRLLGCCSKGEEKMLIYEYMPNKSLNFFLFDPTKQAALDWKKRFYIIEGIARGLLYLHRDSRLRIIHRDLKASNILLDGNMNPKISDFGMARIFGGNQNQANTMRVVGTYGYMAPEYAMEGLFSVKSDVFSFGVLLLEIVSGRRNVNFNYLGKTLNLLGYAWELWSENKLSELLDPSHSLNSTAQVLRCIQVGLLCVQDSAVDRPTMDSVVFMLGTAAAVLPLPKKPAFSTGRTPPESGLLSYSSEVHSVNDVTISAVFGR